MKLVEAEITHDADDSEEEVARPPRPRRRRVYTSLLLTSAVLVGTVVLVYSVFPRRDNELLTETIEAHLSPGSATLDKPTAGEVHAWSVGIFEEDAPWPEDQRLEALAAYRLDVLRRPVALVRYKFADTEISVALTRRRDAVKLVHRRETDGVAAISWGRGLRFVMIAIGPADSQASWKEALGAP
jgi:hypothetical protein